jgi:hypothetical protein
MATGRAKPPKGGKWTEAKDTAYDKSHGIKEGSARDNALDKKRGVPVRKAK